MACRAHATGRGFTLIELVITVALITLVLGISVSGFSQLRQSRQLDSSIEIVSSVFEEARSRSLAGEGDTEWGVHIETTQLILFEGESYSAGDPDNEARTLPSAVTISNISLAGGASDVVFARRTGEVAAHGTITISRVQDATESQTLSISATGLIE